MKNSMSFLKKLRIKLLYEPAIPLLSVHPEEMKSGAAEVISIPMTGAAPFPVASVWK